MFFFFFVQICLDTAFNLQFFSVFKYFLKNRFFFPFFFQKEETPSKSYQVHVKVFELKKKNFSTHCNCFSLFFPFLYSFVCLHSSYKHCRLKLTEVYVSRGFFCTRKYNHIYVSFIRCKIILIHNLTNKVIKYKCIIFDPYLLYHNAYIILWFFFLFGKIFTLKGPL